MLNADNSESRPLMTNEQLASLGGGRVAYVEPHPRSSPDFNSLPCSVPTARRLS